MSGDWGFTVTSKEYGEDYHGGYPTRQAAEEGIARIKAKAKELNDGVERIYTAPEEEGFYANIGRE